MIFFWDRLNWLIKCRFINAPVNILLLYFKMIKLLLKRINCHKKKISVHGLRFNGISFLARCLLCKTI